jgi:hypothetical protein
VWPLFRGSGSIDTSYMVGEMEVPVAGAASEDPSTC